MRQPPDTSLLDKATSLLDKASEAAGRRSVASTMIRQLIYLPALRREY
jgi:hypothetical protein